MKANTKHWSDAPSPSAPPMPLKGSDFFPPGAGWNHAKSPDDSTQKYPTDKQPSDREKH